MKNIILTILLFPTLLIGQQRVQFHPQQMTAKWIHDPSLGPNGGEVQKITGPMPSIVLKSLVYNDNVNVWEIFTGRVVDSKGLSWQSREILRDGEWIDIDSKGNITVEWEIK